MLSVSLEIKSEKTLEWKCNILLVKSEVNLVIFHYPFKLKELSFFLVNSHTESSVRSGNQEI